MINYPIELAGVAASLSKFRDELNQASLGRPVAFDAKRTQRARQRTRSSSIDFTFGLVKKTVRLLRRRQERHKLTTLKLGRLGMSRTLILGTLFAGLLMNSSWAQNKGEPQARGPSYPGASEITFQWDYSCPSGSNCSFTCTGTGSEQAM